VKKEAEALAAKTNVPVKSSARHNRMNALNSFLENENDGPATRRANRLECFS